MRTLLTLVLWCLLFVLCWPIALAVLFLWPVVWLPSLSFRLVGIVFVAPFTALRALLLLPGRLLGARRRVRSLLEARLPVQNLARAFHCARSQTP